MKTLFTFLLISFSYLSNAQEVETSIQFIRFDMADTAIVIQYKADVNALGGFTQNVTSKRFKLRQSAARDSLRNEPLANAALIRMGQFLSNQFPPE